jgi:hypothetical protein
VAVNKFVVTKYKLIIMASNDFKMVGCNMYIYCHDFCTSAMIFAVAINLLHRLKNHLIPAPPHIQKKGKQSREKKRKIWEKNEFEKNTG